MMMMSHKINLMMMMQNSGHKIVLTMMMMMIQNSCDNDDYDADDVVGHSNVVDCPTQVIFYLYFQQMTNQQPKREGRLWMKFK